MKIDGMDKEKILQNNLFADCSDKLIVAEELVWCGPWVGAGQKEVSYLYVPLV